MKEYDWGNFILRVSLESDINKIYDSWAAEAGLERLHLRSAQYYSMLRRLDFLKGQWILNTVRRGLYSNPWSFILPSKFHALAKKIC